jgi:hypothetical protein
VKNGTFLLTDTSADASKRKPQPPTRIDAASEPASALDERADWERDRAARCASRIEPFVDGPAPTGGHDAASPRTASAVDAPNADAESIECADAAAEHVLEDRGWGRKHTRASGLIHGDSARRWRCDEFTRPSRPQI